MFVNHSSKEVTAKVVYYGPGLSGKTTNLQYIFSVTNPKTRGELISVETEIERTLFFDLLPINVGLIKGYQTKFQLYTVPGQVFYDATRKLVLKGADGVVFVADSQELMKTANLESLENLKKNLAGNNLDFYSIPLVFQFNKRDLNNILTVEELNRMVNLQLNRPTFSAVATQGTGVIETLRAISSLILQKIKILLEHSDAKTDKAPTVNFDTDKKHKIIDREDLPIKKIQAEDLEAAKLQMEPLKPNLATNPSHTPPITPKAKEKAPEKKKEEKEDDEWLTVETMEEFRDLEELVLGDDMIQIEEIPDLAELVVDDDTGDYPPNAKKIDTVELAKKDSLATPPYYQKEVKVHLGDDEPSLDIDAFELSDPEEENNPSVDELPDLEGIQFDVDDLGPATEIAKQSVPEPDTNPFPSLEIEPAFILEQEPFPQSMAETDFKLETEFAFELEPLPSVPASSSKAKTVTPNPIDLLKKSLAVQKNEKPTAKNKPNEPMKLDLFERLKDKTRVTVIRDVPITDSHFVIEIRDKNSRVLDTVNVTITPDTKKVNLILDVKK